MSDDRPEYKTGYGKPPNASQFQKGQSGNPRGRPRKKHSRRATAARVFGEVRRWPNPTKGRRVLHTTLEVLVMTLKTLAAAGGKPASALYVRYIERFGTQESRGAKLRYLVVPERLTREEWEAKYAPKDGPLREQDEIQ